MEMTIYMPLLNEGTDVWRTVTAVELGSRRFRVVSPIPEGEEWAFTSGSTVIIDDDRRIVAEADA